VQIRTYGSTTARRIAGQRPGFVDEVRSTFDLHVGWGSHDDYRAAHRRLDALLPGSGPQAPRLRAYRKGEQVPPARLEAAVAALSAALRERTAARIGLPSGETVGYRMVGDAHADRMARREQAPRQVARGAQWTARVQNSSEATVRIPSVRGEIRDRNGVSLVQNRASYEVDFYLPEMVKGYRQRYGRPPETQYRATISGMPKDLKEPDIVRIVNDGIVPRLEDLDIARDYLLGRATFLDVAAEGRIIDCGVTMGSWR